MASLRRARIAEAEQALGLRFPPTYRRFLTGVGALYVAGVEGIFGVSPLGRVTDRTSHAVWLTLTGITNGWVTPGLVAVAHDGIGDYYVLDGRTAPEEAEFPVSVWVPGLSRPACHLEVIAHDFGAFFRDVVEYPDNW